MLHYFKQLLFTFGRIKVKDIFKDFSNINWTKCKVFYLLKGAKLYWRLKMLTQISATLSETRSESDSFFFFFLWSDSLMQPVDNGGSCVHPNDWKIFISFMLFTGNCWHVAAGHGAKCNTIFCALLAWDCDKSKCRTTISTLLTLCSHPTVDTRNRPNDVRVWLSRQVHLLPSSIWNWAPNSASCKCTVNCITQ